MKRKYQIFWGRQEFDELGRLHYPHKACVLELSEKAISALLEGERWNIWVPTPWWNVSLFERPNEAVGSVDYSKEVITITGIRMSGRMIFITDSQEAVARYLEIERERALVIAGIRTDDLHSALQATGDNREPVRGERAEEPSIPPMGDKG